MFYIRRRSVYANVEALEYRTAGFPGKMTHSASK